MRIKKALDVLNGIQDSDVQIGLVKVKFDEKVLKKEDLERAITNSGYKVAA